MAARTRVSRHLRGPLHPVAGLAGGFLMGHLRRRGNAWELRVSAYGRTHTRTFRGSEAAAKKALRVYELDLRGGGQDTDRTTVSELLETFMLSRDLSPTTEAEYRRAQAAIPDSWAKTPIH